MQHKFFSIALATLILPIGITTYAQAAPSSDAEFDQLLSLDIADLTVTSVSKREQKVSDTAAAVYVITQEDLRRSAITSIPDALRMVPGLQVARVSASSWAISSRGFNGALSNKLLVLIDGRSIYTPVFSGVYWDDQSTMIEDIERIEVIRGPGASLWGANAVDGIINIITKSSDKTQGNFASATGTTTGGLLEVRHGGAISPDLTYRTYAQYFNSGSSQNPSNTSNNDSWYRGRGGFRMDGKNSGGDTYTLQGNAYGGKEDTESHFAVLTSPDLQTSLSDSTSYGANLLGRWTHQLSTDSQVTVQSYVDHYSRLETNDDQHVSTADIEAQHSIKLNDRNNFIWGGGARVYEEQIDGNFSIAVNHPHQTHEILNTFLQDEYALLPNMLYATLGSKFEYNDYTGVEIEPTARLSWHVTRDQTVWGAVSRAVRTPSTIDEDINLALRTTPGTPTTVSRIVGNTDQESEVLIAYELGHRIQATRDLSFDTSVYYNDFSRLETVNTVPGAAYTNPADGTVVLPFQISNLGSGHVYGAEITSNWNISERWRLSGSYTYANMSLDTRPGATSLQAAQSLTPHNQFSARSYFNLTDTIHWDNMLYYVSALAPPVNAYTRYDSRLAWLVKPGVEISLIGRNLLSPRHLEFASTPETEVARSFVAQVRWRF
jgi:iron complex outermembrane receptor protein